jgi:hypothetical protein
VDVKVRLVLVVAMMGLGLVTAAASDKEKEAAPQNVDSGSFGVFLRGQRVGTETFSIQQQSNGSLVTSEFKTEGATDKAIQSSQLQLMQNGDLRKYEWKEIAPGKAQAVVLPNDNLLVERSSASPQDKQEEYPFLLPASTNMLDDYFFVHREVLAWKYLATGCRQEKGQVQCQPNQRTSFGTLNPHSRASSLVSLEFVKRESVAVRGVARELIRLTLRGEGFEWAMWLDDQFKLIRIVIPGQETEVVRD